MSNDHKLQEAVLAELNWAPSITAAHIGVAAKDGVVTLTGISLNKIFKSGFCAINSKISVDTRAK